jgi:hypothetical protein
MFIVFNQGNPKRDKLVEILSEQGRIYLFPKQELELTVPLVAKIPTCPVFG